LAGVTGTNGKSTVAYLIAQAQTHRGAPCGYLGTLGHGVPPALAEHTLTTPDCLSLHRLLRGLEASYAAVEVSSHALAQNRTAGLKFHTAVFTNLSRDHLDYHGDLASYGAAKARLFQLEGLRKAVIFRDDAFGETLARGLPASVERIGVGFGSQGELRGQIVESTLTGLQIRLSGPRGDGMMTSPLVGGFNAENLLLALGVLLAWDVPLADACQALDGCSGLPGRMEIVGGASGQPWVVVDYAHTPAALERVLGTLHGLSHGELWCVFGAGGDRDAGKRSLMGAAVARHADHVVLTDDNPRREDPGAIVADIRSGLTDHPDVWIEHDRGKAISAAVSQARAGDVVLVAGKGHEAWQWVGDGRRAFSDRAAARAALEGRG